MCGKLGLTNEETIMIDKNMPIDEIRKGISDISDRLWEIQGRIWGDDYTQDMPDPSKVLTNAEKQEVMKLEGERRKLKVLLVLKHN